jgi:hypothetical protein
MDLSKPRSHSSKPSQALLAKFRWAHTWHRVKAHRWRMLDRSTPFQYAEQVKIRRCQIQWNGWMWCQRQSIYPPIINRTHNGMRGCIIDMHYRSSPPIFSGLWWSILHDCREDVGATILKNKTNPLWYNLNKGNARRRLKNCQHSSWTGYHLPWSSRHLFSIRNLHVTVICSAIELRPVLGEKIWPGAMFGGLRELL